ncbi:hypothetical protein HK102_012824, partial [Quaeritorhiza haematococci]
RTSKYTPLTFLPKNLYEQFRSVANIYFCSLVILQGFEPFATVSIGLTAVPILFIVAVTGIKDAVEDWRRHKADGSVNGAVTYTLWGWGNGNVPGGSVATRPGQEVTAGGGGGSGGGGFTQKLRTLATLISLWIDDFIFWFLAKLGKVDPTAGDGPGGSGDSLTDDDEDEDETGRKKFPEFITGPDYLVECKTACGTRMGSRENSGLPAAMGAASPTMSPRPTLPRGASPTSPGNACGGEGGMGVVDTDPAPSQVIASAAAQLSTLQTQPSTFSTSPTSHPQLLDPNPLTTPPSTTQFLNIPSSPPRVSISINTPNNASNNVDINKDVSPLRYSVSSYRSGA